MYTLDDSRLKGGLLSSARTPIPRLSVKHVPNTVGTRDFKPPTEYDIQRVYALVDSGYDFTMLLAYCDNQPETVRPYLVGAVMHWAMTIEDLNTHDSNTNDSLRDTHQGTGTTD